MPSRYIFLNVIVFCAVSGISAFLPFPARVLFNSLNRFFSEKLSPAFGPALLPCGFFFKITHLRYEVTFVKR